MKSNHRGFTIVEMLAASALTAMLVTMCVQMLSSTAVQRRATERRMIALAEAANVTESLGSLAWDEITSERITQYRLSESAQQILGGGVLKIALEPSTSGPPAKLVRVEITWPGTAGGTDPPVRLSSWIFSRGKAPSP
jgi:prepilin-type N-terminal cleavage/methylation domain-containing protein